MTRRRFPLVDLVIATGSSGPRLGDPARLPHGVQLALFVDEAGTTPAACLLDGDPVDTVTIDGASIPEFDGPDDGTMILWARAVDSDDAPFAVRCVPVDGGGGGDVDLSGYVEVDDPRLSDDRDPNPHTHPVVDVVGFDAAAQALIDAAVTAAVDGLVNGAPGALDTLAELAAALGDDQDAIDALVASVATRAAASDVVALTALVATKVANTDPRLTDSRTPLAHVHALADVTGLGSATAAAQGLVELATNAETLTGTDTVRAVTPAGVKAAIDALIAGAPGALDTLAEIATQLGNDESAVSALTTTVSGKLAKASNLSDVANAATARGNLSAAPLSHVTDLANPHAVTAAQVGLGSVENAAPKTRLLDKYVGAISPGVVNTVAETTLFSLTIPAALVAAGDFLALDYLLDARNFSGANADIAYRFKVGATTVFSFTPTLASNTNRYKIVGRMTILLASLTDLRCGLAGEGTTFSTAAAAAAVLAQSPTGTAQVTTEDLSTDKFLTVTAQPTVAAATIDARPVGAALTRTRT